MAEFNETQRKMQKLIGSTVKYFAPGITDAQIENCRKEAGESLLETNRRAEEFVARKKYEYGFYDIKNPTHYARMFHEELLRFGPESKLPENSRVALELGLEQESKGVADARPLRKIREADGSYRYERISSAYGGMQIIDPTWNALTKKHGEKLTNIEGVDPADPRGHPFVQARAASLLAADDLQLLRRGVPKRDFNEQPLNAGETYLAHFAGGPRAARILSAKDDTPIASLVSANVIENHEKVQFNGKPFAKFTARDLKDWAQHKMEGHLGKVANIASRDGDPIGTLIAYQDAAKGKEFNKDVLPKPMTTGARLADDAWHAAKVGGNGVLDGGEWLLHRAGIGARMIWDKTVGNEPAAVPENEVSLSCLNVKETKKDPSKPVKQEAPTLPKEEAPLVAANTPEPPKRPSQLTIEVPKTPVVASAVPTPPSRPRGI